VLGIDWQLRLGEAARQVPPEVAVQGNLDPFLLTATPEHVALATRELLQEMRDRSGYIFNLGHGVPPAAKLENIACLVETVRGLVPAGACGNLPS